jgi:hypothetical protein
LLLRATRHRVLYKPQLVVLLRIDLRRRLYVQLPILVQRMLVHGDLLRIGAAGLLPMLRLQLPGWDHVWLQAAGEHMRGAGGRSVLLTQFALTGFALIAGLLSAHGP